MVVVLVCLHIFYLHINGGANPLGVPSTSNKVPFHYYFSAKDRYVFVVFFFAFIYVTLVYGYDLMDAEN